MRFSADLEVTIKVRVSTSLYGEDYDDAYCDLFVSAEDLMFEIEQGNYEEVKVNVTHIEPY